jgi:hypothetical protein
VIVQEELLNDVLNQVAIELDIPPHKYKEAMERFDAIKRHLEKGHYPGSTPPPNIYLQGSFRLGTVIRPIIGGRECGFDIDIVCQINRDKNVDDPETLKGEVGAEVKGYAEKNSMERPANGRRCWALNYAADSEGVGFHVDILPCLPDMIAGSQISRLNASQGATVWQYSQTTVAITNRNEDVSPPEHGWRSSNPLGFAKWFNDICLPGYAHVDNRRQKELLFEVFGQRQNFPYRRAEDIPEALVRTPLQRAIQIMKRHRDVRFKGRRDEKHKPISMIITTLAARQYAGRASQYQTTRSVLRIIVETLAQHAALVDKRQLLEDVSRMQLIRRVGDTWYIPNPVNPHNPGDPDDKGENFADRWHEDDHAKAKAFFQWVGWLQADLDSLLNSNDIAGMEGTLTEAFGNTIATRALNRLGVTPSMTRSGAVVRASSTALARFDVSHRERPQWPENYRYDVVLTARLHRNGFRPRDLRNEGEPVPKWCSLTFQARTTVPRPFKVYWQVVNTGMSAADAGDLRGKIIDAQLYRGDLTWDRESTKYTGMHWIECFIVKDGYLVAHSGEFVVNIE